ncbi:MAG: sugar phosphate isomerase/epimerase [Clostridia bacterium]|nr:sugar phosphate isomerase/epimerase [Clostridia bacterium]MBQ3954942.1 sugar phosphate isomerase/epimerase [Clostridia bacterium]MBQ5355728.1 sugar phosphate isomerase/epimerase [Clostridia bacterium]
MVRFRISAFSDEYSPNLDEQIEGLLANHVRMTELRNVDGTSVSDLTPAEAAEVRRKLDAHGITVSSIGSPLGKISVTDPMEPHLDKLKNTCELAGVLGTGRIRMFSFYIPDGKYEEYRGEVFDRIGKMLDAADGYGVQLCHENEKGIYGDTPERCAELLAEFPGRLGCVFDPANFVQCGAKPFPDAYELLKTRITYMHIKDALPAGTIVPSGMGVGGVPEILSVLNLTRTGDFVLTVEPHLRVFAGLDKLEAGQAHTALGNAYATASEAFAAAVEHLRWCLPRNSQSL